MPDYIEIDLESVDLSYPIPPAGDYLASIEKYTIETKDDGSLKWILFEFMLLQGPEEGIGMKVQDRHDLNNDIGKKKMKQMALAADVPFDSKRIDLEPFSGRQVGVKIVIKPSKNDPDQKFANISKYFTPAPPIEDN